MPHYLLVHKVAEYPRTQDDWIEQWREVRRNAIGDVEWVQAFFDPAEGKLYCQWRAEDMESIFACFTPNSQEQAPLEYSGEIILFDTLWLD